MAYVPITPLPPAPARSDAPATFITLADAFLAALAAWETQVNAAGTYIDGVGVQTALDAAETAADAVSAAASAAASIAASGAVAWVSGTTYAKGDAVWSPIDLQTYRRRIAGAGTTDPSDDSTNWAELTVSIEALHAAALYF